MDNDKSGSHYVIGQCQVHEGCLSIFGTRQNFYAALFKILKHCLSPIK